MVPVFRILALLLALVGGVAVLIAAAADFPHAIGKGLVVLVIGWAAVGLVCLSLFAFSELIVVVIEIERRTRALEVDFPAVEGGTERRGLYAEMALLRRRQS